MGKASTYQRRARDFAQKADWDAALSELRQAASADPGNPMLQNQMGDLFLRKEEVSLACQHFEKAIELYAGLGLHNNAVALCRKVVRLCPSRLEVRYQLACLRHEQGLHSEASACFVDYFEHLPGEGEGAIRVLEERSTEVFERYPESVPVGKVLEKLEEARSFACAFGLVQRMAQRAADAGDDGAARRYTTKMRSLRVLVESHGGDLPEPGQPQQANRKEAEVALESSSQKSTPLTAQDGVLSTTRAGGWMEPSAVLEPSMAEEPNVLLEPEPSGLEGLESPSFDGPPDAGLPESPGAALSPLHEEALPEIEIETQEIHEGVDSILPSPEPEGPEEDDAATPEYEIPETSLDDVASLWSEDETGGIAGFVKPDRVASPSRDTDSFPDLILEEEPASTFESESRPGSHRFQEAPFPAKPARDGGFQSETHSPAAGLPQPELESGLVEAADTTQATSGDWMEEITPPATTARWRAPVMESQVPPPVARTPLQEPVWVPDDDWRDPNQAPDLGSGSTHELSEVIDTFRKQMAEALGDDASARYDLGVAYYEMGLYDEALSEFEVAQPNAALRERTLEMMAACMAMQGRHAEILSLLAPALEAPDAPDRVLGLRYSMGVACEALGRRDEARRHFEAVARIDSGYRDVRHRLQLR